MALIWADGFTGEKALAPAWREVVLAKGQFEQAKADLEGHAAGAQQFAAAYQALATAQTKYQSLVAEAGQALKQLAQNGQSRTHVRIVGVGRYDSAAIMPAVTTSVLGARAFADWILTRFVKSDRPLGSVEMLGSPAPGQADWTPSSAAAARLGLNAAAGALALPDEAATFANIQAAFARWLERAGASPDNAAFWYFSGHGLFKSETLLLPQDAQLPSETRSAGNLIAPARTMSNMQNIQPSTQCFFVDACSETNMELIFNVEEQPGSPLCRPPSGGAIARRDATIYFGSYAGGKAYGPENAPPYFTQELLSCLERRAGDPGWGGKQVTMSSLSSALQAAAVLRAEQESNPGIQFSETKPGMIACNAVLCELRGPVEVLVQVRCLPKDAMPTAKLFVEIAGRRTARPAPHVTSWCTTVAKGQFTAGARFDPPSQFGDVALAFDAVPPVSDASLEALTRSEAAAGAAGGDA